MDSLDCIAPIAQNAHLLEGVDPGFLLENLKQAQLKSWDALKAIRDRLEIGMTEDDARKMALQVFSELGVTKHWHRPYIRFGAGTTLTFEDPMRTDARLQKDDPVYIDLGPVWQFSGSPVAYEGDVGDTFTMGTHPEAEACAMAARQIFREAQAEWKAKGLTGADLYEYIRVRSEALGYRWVSVAGGHRIGDFPHHKHTKERIDRLRFSPKASLWVLEVQIADPHGKFGAFYEDLL